MIDALYQYINYLMKIITVVEGVCVLRCNDWCIVSIL